MKKIKLTEAQLKRLLANEQLLKNLGDKIKSGVQNVVDKVKGGQNKEVTQPGTINKGRDLEQLRAEWTKINQDTTNMSGYGEAVSPTLSSARMQAQVKARVVILKKLGKQEATFGSDIVDEATFQLENGNYVNLVLIKMREQQINEEISRIKSVMGINENEEGISPELMKSFEDEADKMIAKSQEEKKEIEELIKRIEAAAEQHGNKEMFQSLIDDNKRKLNSFYSADDKFRIVNALINQYKQAEAFRKYGEERAERAKTAKITKEQIIDVFVTAIEGGSNYWYYILDVPKEITYMVKREDVPFSEACGKHVLNGGELTIYDVEEVGDMEDVDNDYAQDKPDPLGTITMDSLLDAINIMKRDYPDRYESIVMDEYDAEDADVFFQIATMGEIVYG